MCSVDVQPSHWNLEFFFFCRFRRAVEQQELGHSFVDKELDQNFAEEAAPAARRDESGLFTLFGTHTHTHTQRDVLYLMNT